MVPLLSWSLCSSPQHTTTMALQNPFSASLNRSVGTMSGKLTPETAENAGPLSSIVEKLDNSWPRQLTPETEINLLKSQSHESLSPKSDDNRSRRPVYNGHYVLVKPTGLPNPRLVLYSEDVAKSQLKLSEEQIGSEEFIKWVSGNLVLGETWATPYALSIMGNKYTSNCPYGTGGRSRKGSLLNFVSIIFLLVSNLG